MVTNEVATDRLLLRPIQMEDAPALATIYTDADVSRFLRPLDQNQTRSQVEGFVREWVERDVGIFAVFEQATGDLIGRSGLHYWPQFEETEVGWVLRRDRWRQGYASEAGKASLRWGFSAGLDMITAIIADANEPSIAVASRLGMTALRAGHLFDHEVTVFAAYAR